MKNILCILFLSIAFYLSFSARIFPQNNLWEPTGGPAGQSIKALAIDATGTIFAGSWLANGQIFRSTDNGDHWQQITGWTTQHSVWSLLVTPSQEILAATNGGAGIYISIDNGDSWQAANNGLTTNAVNAIAVNDSSYLFAATDYGMFRSTDRGENWEEVNSGLPQPYAIMVLTVAVDSGGNVFIGTFGNGIYRSTNNGDTWEEKNNGITQLFINSIVVYPNGSIFAAPETGSGVYRSTDSGDSWQFFDTGLPVWENTYVLTIAPNGNILAGLSDSGVFISSDNGEHWSDYSSGLPSQHVRAVAVNDLGYGFAGVSAQGVFRTINPITKIDRGENTIADEFELYQNFPNPFNPLTVINYQLPIDNWVTLKIYDILGHEVKTLVMQPQTAGHHTVRWDGRDNSGKQVSSGIYIYRLKSGELVKSRKMLLTR